jgi:type VI secretion system secreted protein Hcp
MAGNMFLKLTNIQGESLDFIHEGEIEVQDWTWGLDNPAPFRLEAKQASKQTEFDVLTITKMFDKSSTTLMTYCASGEKIPTGLLTCRKNDDEQQHVAYLTIELTDVKVDKVSWDGKGEDPRGVPETVELSFSKVHVIYQTQLNDGSLTGQVDFEFDVANQKTAK